MRLTNQQGYNLKDQAIFTKYNNKSYPSHKKNSSAAWSPQGTILATGDNSLRLWSFDENYGISYLTQNKGRDAQVSEIKFINNNELITVNRDSFKLWDTRKQLNKPMVNQKKSKPQIIALTWNHQQNNPHFAILTKDNTINIYDIRNMNNLSNPIYSDKNKNDITQIQYDYSNSIIFMCGSDGSSSSSSANGILSIYTNTLQFIAQLITPHNSRINSIAVDPCNNFVATCSDDSLTAIYTLPDIITQRIYSHTDCAMKKVAFSCKAEYLAVSCEQPKMEQMQINNKGEQVKIQVEQPCIDFYNIVTGGHAHRIKCGNIQQVLEWHPKKNILAYFDFNQEDSKKVGNQKQQRYLHIYGM